MSSTEETVAVLGSNHHETEPAPTTTTTTAPTTTATIDSHTENVNADNQLDVPPTSSSAEPVAPDAASTTMGEEPRSESGAHTENQHQEGETLENEHPLNSTEESSTAAPTPATATPVAESSGDIPVATVIATPSAAAATTSTQPKTENPDATAISAADGEAFNKPQLAKEVVATAAAAAAEEDEEETGPGLTITLLLITGARHPFKIDRKYLKRRSIKVENDDPFKMSVYTLKELIWREWRSEWEPQPSSPSAIRLISFGKLLDDKSPLSESSLTYDAPNVIHMTVKPQEAVDEEDAKGGKSYSGRDREATDRSPGCRCIIL